MRPVKRSGVNKRSAVKGFRKATSRTKAINFAGPMRGGIRL